MDTNQVEQLNKIAAELISLEYATKEEIESIHNPGAEPSEWLKDAQNLVRTVRLTTAMRSCGVEFCELCIQSSIVTLATTKRDLTEDTGHTSSELVCNECAEMLDDDCQGDERE